jgi:flagellin-like hook-associated protein FlgL
MKKLLLPITVVLFLLAIAGCGPTVEEARTTFCANLTAYGQALRALEAVDATTTVDELNETLDAVAQTREAVIASGGDLREAKLESVETEWETLQNMVRNVSGDATLGGAALAIQTQATVVQAEIARLNNVICTR